MEPEEGESSTGEEVRSEKEAMHVDDVWTDRQSSRQKKVIVV